VSATRGSRRAIARVVALLAVAALGLVAARPWHDIRALHSSLPYYDDATLTPRWRDARDAADAATTHHVGDFHLVDAHGKSVSRADVAGRVYVAAFFYSECRTLCPNVRDQLARVHEAFAGDTLVRILSHSVSPERDDPARLDRYAAHNHVDGVQWRLLTGSRAELERLARDAYFVELSDTTGNTSGRLRHTETLLLVDGEGRIRGAYDGSLAYDVDQLIADIRVLRNATSRTNTRRGSDSVDTTSAATSSGCIVRSSGPIFSPREAAITVFTVLGRSAVTRTSCLRTSADSDSVKRSTAALEPEYAARLSAPLRPAVDATLMMSPLRRSIIDGSTARVT
jgi:protein SCO1/2